MEVGKITAYTVRANQKTRETGVRSPVKESGSEGGAQGKADRVELSKGYQEMLQAKRSTLGDNDIRTEEVERLRSMVERDTYVVEPEQIAGRMLEAVW